jgi:DNA-binding PucR family transcriptional regulator
VEPLRRYDEKNNASLLATVRAYTDNHQNTAATAAALFVHANTVNLRLRRAEEVLGASLSNLDHLTALRASLLIDDVKRNPLR